jgi:hypothetical protein
LLSGNQYQQAGENPACLLLEMVYAADFKMGLMGMGLSLNSVATQER